jgi:hypothetical protein
MQLFQVLIHLKTAAAKRRKKTAAVRRDDASRRRSARETKSSEWIPNVLSISGRRRDAHRLAVNGLD